MNKINKRLVVLGLVALIIFFPNLLKLIGYSSDNIVVNIIIRLNMLVLLIMYLSISAFAHLKTHGIKTIGTVTDIEHLGMPSGCKNESRLPRDKVELEYQVKSNTKNLSSPLNQSNTMRSKIRMLRYRLDYPIIGSEVPIIYSPNMPQKIVLEETVKKNSRYIVLLIPCISLLCVIVLAIVTKKII